MWEKIFIGKNFNAKNSGFHYNTLNLPKNYTQNIFTNNNIIFSTKPHINIKQTILSADQWQSLKQGYRKDLFSGKNSASDFV